MPKKEREGYYFGAMDIEALPTIMRVAQKKRLSERVIIEYSAKSLKAHLKGADRIDARFCAVIGENELQSDKIWVKDLQNRTEELISLDEMLSPSTI
jgi:histidyl-tRNA synthetase